MQESLLAGLKQVQTPPTYPDQPGVTDLTNVVLRPRRTFGRTGVYPQTRIIDNSTKMLLMIANNNVILYDTTGAVPRLVKSLAPSNRFATSEDGKIMLPVNRSGNGTDELWIWNEETQDYDLKANGLPNGSFSNTYTAQIISPNGATLWLPYNPTKFLRLNKTNGAISNIYSPAIGSHSVAFNWDGTEAVISNSGTYFSYSVVKLGQTPTHTAFTTVSGSGADGSLYFAMCGNHDLSTLFTVAGNGNLNILRRTPGTDTYVQHQTFTPEKDAQYITDGAIISSEMFRRSVSCDRTGTVVAYTTPVCNSAMFLKLNKETDQYELAATVNTVENEGVSPLCVNIGSNARAFTLACSKARGVDDRVIAGLLY